MGGFVSGRVWGSTEKLFVQQMTKLAGLWPHYIYFINWRSKNRRKRWKWPQTCCHHVAFSFATQFHIMPSPCVALAFSIVSLDYEHFSLFFSQLLLSYDEDFLLFSNICLFAHLFLLFSHFFWLLCFSSLLFSVFFYGSSVFSYNCFLSLVLSASIPSWSSCSGDLLFCCLQLSTWVLFTRDRWDSLSLQHFHTKQNFIISP